MYGIFLDREGTLNYSVFNINTEEYEAPHNPDDFELFPYTISTLKKLQDMNYLLFLITNQPDAAKGKTTLKNIKDVHNKFHKIMVENGIKFRKYYYCIHHPSVSECKCRKPSPHFIKEAEKEYGLNLEKSWMIGDRETDVICGKEAGTRTIRIGEKSNLSDFIAKDIREAAEIIKFFNNISR